MVKFVAVLFGVVGVVTAEVFDCAKYVSTCSGTTNYMAYPNCAATVLYNPTGMTCRITHLGLAMGTGANDAATHCNHAMPAPTAPCNAEILVPVFDCAKYVSTCSATSKYVAYSGCKATVMAKTMDMTCRIKHLGLAMGAGADDAKTHCPHAQEVAAGPCAATTTAAPTGAATTTAAATAVVSSANGASEFLASKSLSALSALILVIVAS